MIEGYQPLLSYYRNAPTLRLWVGHPDYVGESWTARGPVEPVEWSPNRLVFQVEPHEEVHVNQNPGSWWLVNGERRFADLRCAVMMEPFAVEADDEGRLVLQVRPPDLWVAPVLHGVGLLLVVAAWPWRRPPPPPDTESGDHDPEPGRVQPEPGPQPLRGDPQFEPAVGVGPRREG